MTKQFTDYDSPWKEVIELYFPRFLELFEFPVAKLLDYKQGWKTLE
ncbi:hypothetical protein [Nostoc sp. UIC 10630]|nr:hypothetical protein [Nostoc sp. UIC 10630]